MQLSAINDLPTPAERHFAKVKLLHEETAHLFTLEQLKSTAHQNRKEQRVIDFFNKVLVFWRLASM